MSNIIAWIFIWFDFSISICIFIILYLLFQYITKNLISNLPKKLPNRENISFIFINVHNITILSHDICLQYKLKFYYQFNVYYFIINFCQTVKYDHLDMIYGYRKSINFIKNKYVGWAALAAFFMMINKMHDLCIQEQYGLNIILATLLIDFRIPFIYVFRT